MVNQILQYTFGGLELVFLLLAYFSRQRRVAWLTAAVCTLSAAIAAHYDSF